MQKQIFTIGHSTHPVEYFLELLQWQQIDQVVDVRSVPASKYNPQYNQEPLANYLQNNGVAYVHFKDAFGARQEDEDVLDGDNQVNFERFRKTFSFQQGVEKIDIAVSQGQRIALMCSEGNPLECHRFSMIAVHFDAIGFDVQHILKDKSVMSHKALEQQLLEKYKKKLPVPTLFEPDITEKDKLTAAYQLHNKEIGWVVKEQYPDMYQEDVIP